MLLVVPARPAGGGAVSRLHIFRPALVFVLGFTTIFVLLGISAMALGGVLQRFQTETNLIGGALVIVFGLAMTGLLRLPMLMADHRWNGPGQRTGRRLPAGRRLCLRLDAMHWPGVRLDPHGNRDLVRQWRDFFSELTVSDSACRFFSRPSSWETLPPH